jgi:hypothetical protein
VTTLWPVVRSNSGTSALKAAVNPPEIITCTSAALALLASQNAAAIPSASVRKFVNFDLMKIPPGIALVLPRTIAGPAFCVKCKE